jgi:hypothetical protein
MLLSSRFHKTSIGLSQQKLKSRKQKVNIDYFKAIQTMLENENDAYTMTYRNIQILVWNLILGFGLIHHTVVETI